MPVPASSTSVPFPASGQFVEAVRSSAARAVEKAGIQVTDESMRAFLTSLDREDYLALSQDHGATALPLAFDSPLQELNLLAVLALLNFGSSFRQPLHAHHGRGVYETIVQLVLACHISSTGSEELLSAKSMSTISDTRVAELMGGLPLMEEKAHESLPGVRVGTKGGRLAELVAMVQAVMNTTGRFLIQKGYRDLGSLVAELLRDAAVAHASDDRALVAAVVEGLVRTIPAFQDMYLVDGEPVYLFKKALILVHTVSQRFAPAGAESPFPCPDTTTLVPIFADNVVPSLLVSCSVLTLPTGSALEVAFPAIPPASSNPLLRAKTDRKAPKAAPPLGGPELTIPQAALLRTASVFACERLAAYARTGALDDVPGSEWVKDDVTASGIDGYLWAGGKAKPDWRRLERFACDSIFY